MRALSIIEYGGGGGGEGEGVGCGNNQEHHNDHGQPPAKKVETRIVCTAYMWVVQVQKDLVDLSKHYIHEIDALFSLLDSYIGIAVRKSLVYI